MERVLGLADKSGENLRKLADTKKRHAYIYGFKFLNSDDYVQCNYETNNAIKKGLEKINDSRLILAYQNWIEFGNRRENAMLEISIITVRLIITPRQCFYLEQAIGNQL